MAMNMHRRAFLRAGAAGLGSIALQSLLGAESSAPHFAPKAKHIVFLHMLGGPSQVDLLDPKPALT